MADAEADNTQADNTQQTRIPSNKRRRFAEDDNVRSSLVTPQQGPDPQPHGLDAPSYRTQSPANHSSTMNSATNPPEGYVKSYSNSRPSVASQDFAGGSSNPAINGQSEGHVNAAQIAGHSATGTDNFGQEQHQDLQQAASPAWERVAKIFPQYMCLAIEQNGEGAAIATNFFYNNDNDLRLATVRLEIRSNRVQYIAREMFGIHLETQNGLRYIVFPGGASVVPGPDIFRGAQPEAVNTLLGPIIDRLIAASPVRLQEVRRGVFATHCVTMIVSRNPIQGGMLSLHLGTEGAFDLQEMLGI